MDVESLWRDVKAARLPHVCLWVLMLDIIVIKLKIFC